MQRVLNVANARITALCRLSEVSNKISGPQKIFNNHKQINNMKKNMGTTDKAIRILIAVVILALYFTNVIPGTLGIILLILAGVFVLTSLVGTCPLYLPFGLNTKKKE
jgi:hypothetical protein